MRSPNDSRALFTLGSCLVLLAGCSGSGGSGSGTPSANNALLSVSSVSVVEGSILPLNRSITISFSQEIDFSTVTNSSIQIATADGTIATGSFGPLMLDTTGDGFPDTVDRTTVSWQPACPIRPDNSDAGLRGGDQGFAYSLQVRGQDSGGPIVVTSVTGRALGTSEVRNFTTPATSDPSALFIDPVPGSPRVRVRALGGSLQQGVSFVELGGDSDPNSRLYFERDDPAVQSMVVPGSAVTGGTAVPFNNFANPESRVAFVVEFNQPVSPLASNISDARIRIEYLLPAMGSVWTPIETDVLLLQNCSSTGAQIRLEPVGILPASSQVRVNVLPGFQGIRGLADSTLTGQFMFAVVESADLDNSPLSNPTLGADEILEEFNFGGSGRISREDTNADLVTPSAIWGPGRLTSTLNFPGTGGEEGEFDWIVKQRPESFDTSQQTIMGGPNGELKYEQFTVGGLVDVRDFIILPNAELQVRGPNPFVVNATGEIRIEGLLTISGGGARDVATLNTGSQPEPGGTGICGGGDGGTASEVRANSTMRGGAGFSPFGNGQSGGIGGEFGYPSSSARPNDAPDSRRPGGGGGGQFASDKSDVDATAVGLVPTAGMAAKPGNSGNSLAESAFVTQPGNIKHVPFGGAPGVGPFVDGDDSNDFFGRRADTSVAILADGTAPVVQSVGDIIVGELTGIHAGYGGGAGGDSGPGPRFPTPNWTVRTDEKGGGGGGGAGAIRLRALGQIRFVGVQSRLDCRGARGATGENSIFVDRIGGSGGSGSGGHVILESATNISFELPPLSDRLPSERRRIFVDARGLQGTTGAPTNGNGLTLPPNDSHGGDGGPGVIQLHVPDAISPPHEDDSLSDLVLPVGTIEELDAGDSNALNEVMRPAGIQMLPDFGVRSGAQSRWVDLRRAGLNPDASSNLLAFLFRGVDAATGLVQTTNGRVTELAPILSGPLVPSAGSFVGSNSLELTGAALYPLVISTAPISDDIYLRNPALLRNFLLRMTPSIGVSLDFVIQTATFDSTNLTMLLTVAPVSGVNLSAFDAPSNPPSYALIPRFFGIRTGVNNNSLPAGSSVRLTFEGASADPNGNPDTSSLLVPETSDFADFGALAPGQLDFIRFRVEFNIDTLGNGVTIDTPPISLDFLRLPFLY